MHAVFNLVSSVFDLQIFNMNVKRDKKVKSADLVEEREYGFLIKARKEKKSVLLERSYLSPSG